MRRDDDYIRELLREFEAAPDYLVLSVLTLAGGEEQRKRHYHIGLLCDAGLMVQINEHAFRMTSQGHDFLDAIRNDTIWNRTKAGAAEIGGATLSMLGDIAVAYLKQRAAATLGLSL